MFNEKIINNQEKEEKTMKNTAEFREALDSGKLLEAEKFLTKVRLNSDEFPQYDK